ncbi:hypothetical protein ACMFMG_000106 [Clarireedia jacksonii]
MEPYSPQNRQIFSNMEVKPSPNPYFNPDKKQHRTRQDVADTQTPNDVPDTPFNSPEPLSIPNIGNRNPFFINQMIMDSSEPPTRKPLPTAIPSDWQTSPRERSESQSSLSNPPYLCEHMDKGNGEIATGMGSRCEQCTTREAMRGGDLARTDSVTEEKEE